MSISNFLENELLDAAGGNGTYNSTATYLKLHTGDPGDDGTSNAATETTRKAVSFGSASGGSMSSSATVEWTSVSTSETYSHWSMWDASTAGNCLWTGALSSPVTVVAGDTFQLTSLTLTLD